MYTKDKALARLLLTQNEKVP